MQPNKEVLRKEEEPPAEPRVWTGHWCCQNTPEHGDSGVLGKNQGPQCALLRPPISNQGFPLAKPDTKLEGQGAQVVLSVAVSLPGQEKGRMNLHSVSDSVTSLTSCTCRLHHLDALFKQPVCTDTPHPPPTPLTLRTELAQIL